MRSITRTILASGAAIVALTGASGADCGAPTETHGKNPSAKQVLVDRTLGNGFIDHDRENGTWRSKGPLKRFSHDIILNCRYQIKHVQGKDTIVRHIKGPFTVTIGDNDYWFKMVDCKALYLDHR